MTQFGKQNLPDKKKVIKEEGHPTRAPRLEGVVKESMMQPIKKKKSKD